MALTKTRKKTVPGRKTVADKFVDRICNAKEVRKTNENSLKNIFENVAEKFKPHENTVPQDTLQPDVGRSEPFQQLT